MELVFEGFPLLALCISAWFSVCKWVAVGVLRGGKLGVRPDPAYIFLQLWTAPHLILIEIVRTHFVVDATLIS